MISFCVILQMATDKHIRVKLLTLLLRWASRKEKSLSDARLKRIEMLGYKPSKIFLIGVKRRICKRDSIAIIYVLRADN